MDIKDILLTLSLIFGAFGSIVGSYVAVKSIRPKSLLDSSQAAENFQEIVVKLQAEMEDLRTQQVQDRFMLTEYIRGTKILISQLKRMRVTPDWIPPLDFDQPTKPKSGGLWDNRR